MKKFLTKNHYELMYPYLESINPNRFKQDKLHISDDPTFIEYCTAILDSLSKDRLDKATMAYHNNMYFHLYHMRNSGEQIYYITPELSARLAQTLCNSDVHFLRSPYREIFVQIDPGLFYMNTKDGLKVPIQGFYVYLRDLNEKRHIRIMAVALFKNTSKTSMNESSFYFHINLGFNKIQEELKAYLEENINKKDAETFDIHKNKDHIEEFTTFIFNSLLYITSKNPDITSCKPFDFDKKLNSLKVKNKKRKVKQQKEKTTSKKVIIVGANIQDKNRDAFNIKKAGGVSAWKLQHKVKVCSHWRMQWYGSKKDNTRYCDHIWIDSYNKGPEFSEIVSSKHVVK